MKRALLLIIVGALYVLHQDFWFWREARPLVFGFLPIGLFYHACYTVVTALVMWLLVKHTWPSHLEEGWAEERRGDGAMERMGEERRGDGAKGRGGERGDAAIERRGDGAMGSPVVPSFRWPRRRVASSPDRSFRSPRRRVASSPDRSFRSPRRRVAPSPDPSSPRPFSRRRVTASPDLPIPLLPVASEKGGADQ